MREKTTKTEYRNFTIADWEREQQYLRKRHGEGWKFVRVTFPGFYHFERCEPEDVVYQLDYEQAGQKDRDNYVRMFEDCGWEYLQEYAGYTYFRKPVAQMQGDGDEEIFCDDESRLDMVKRVFWGRLAPLLIIFFLFVPNFINSSYVHIREDDWILTGLFFFVFVLYLYVFFRFGYHYWKLKKRFR